MKEMKHKKIILIVLFFFLIGTTLILLSSKKSNIIMSQRMSASVIVAQSSASSKEVLIKDYLTAVDNQGKLDAMNANTTKEYERNQAILIKGEMEKKTEELEKALSVTLSKEEYETLTEKTKLERYISSYQAIESSWDKNSSTVDMSKIDMSVLNDKVNLNDLINKSLGIPESVFTDAQSIVDTKNTAAQPSTFGKKTYVPLSAIPGLTDSENSTVTMKPFLQLLFKWGIAIAVLLSIVMITFGGFQYMTTDAAFDKSEGKAKINAAIIGLLLALSAWLILQTVDPRILQEPQSAILE